MPRHLPAMLAAWAALAATAAEAASSFPYRAYVSNDDAYVRSGPGENYYPVDRLARGSVVEVYRHDPGGWLAIRPPVGSFSWVAAEFVEPTNGRLGIIVGEKVTARVGSAFSDIRDVIQVRLDHGEEVEIIEAVRFGEGSNARTWYRIAPPAGEFRWISGEDVARNREPRRMAGHSSRERPRATLDADYDDHMLADDESFDNRSDDRFDDHSTAAYEDEDNEYGRRTDADLAAPRRAEFLARLDRLRESRRARRPVGDDDDYAPTRSSVEARHSHSGSSGIGDESRTDARHIPYSRIDDPRESELMDDSGETAGWAADDPLRIELAEIEREMSRIVVDEPSYWNLTPLKSQTDELLGQCQTAVERGRVRLVQRRIQRFLDIQQRHETLAAVQADTDHRNRQFAGGNATAEQATASSNRRHDGEGRLTQVANGSTGAASYALVGPTGEVQYYITPSPGVNLRPYLGRDVGVSGTLGYMPDALTPHVTARRIEAIDGVIRR